ncbi:hypothetical protein O181_077974 [Austropuccinia psidii MF-1]|uniref:Uncharacterized protein n=1 Tax=Austropuccinia psidii MF-1 TaxID=1389203 RepID=A0A9Q3FFK7_9BASI|nr:hypothetical protein [Austropuccinia psidii MF-1]
MFTLSDPDYLEKVTQSIDELAKQCAELQKHVADLVNTTKQRKMDPQELLEDKFNMMSLVDQDNRARIANNTDLDESKRLKPLYSLKTGLILQNLPINIEALEKLSESDLKELLEELEQEVPLSKQERQHALKLALGIHNAQFYQEELNVF